MQIKGNKCAMERYCFPGNFQFCCSMSINLWDQLNGSEPYLALQFSGEILKELLIYEPHHLHTIFWGGVHVLDRAPIMTISINMSVSTRKLGCLCLL